MVGRKHDTLNSSAVLALIIDRYCFSLNFIFWVLPTSCIWPLASTSEVCDKISKSLSDLFLTMSLNALLKR